MTFIYESMQFLFFIALGLGVFFGVNALEDQLDQHTFPAEITYLHAFSKVLLHIIGYFFATVVACTYAGVGIQLLLLSIGALLVLALILFNSIIKQIIAGVYVIFTKPFQAGDTIALDNGTNGVVVGFNLQHVVLECKHQFVLIPNTTLLAQTLHVTPNKKTPRISKKKAKET